MTVPNRRSVLQGAGSGMNQANAPGHLSSSLPEGTVPAPGVAGSRERDPWHAIRLGRHFRLSTGHLTRQIDARAILMLSVLVGADLLLIATHSILRIMVKLYYGDVEVFDGMWYIDQEFSYSEILGYAKMIVIVALLTRIQLVSRSWLYVGWIAIFAVALLDDAFGIHEHLGHGLVRSIAVTPTALQGQVGELLIWAAAGLPLLALVLAGVALAPSSLEDRSNTLLLLLAFAVFACFSVGIDTLHMAVGEFVYGAGLLLSTMEDGGEQILLSLIFGLVLLMYRSKHR